LIVPDLMAALRAAGLGAVGVIVGGIVPESERPALIDAGVDSIFGPGASREEIVATVEDLSRRSRDARLVPEEFAS
ncbi:MAG: methylmalonyl-CoA mutase, partial [Patulibacter sp.]